MPIETSDMIHKAVLWILGAPDYTGTRTAEDGYPLEIDCRWEDRYEEIVDERGKVITVDSTIAVKQEVPVGAMIWRGPASSLPADWDNIRDVKRVYFVQNVSDLKGKHTRRVLKVKKSNDVVPTTTTAAP